MKRFKSTGVTADIPKIGRPRKLTSKTQRLIAIKSELNPRWTANHLVSVDIVKRAKLFGRVAVKKPFLSKINKIRRLKWCRKNKPGV